MTYIPTPMIDVGGLAACPEHSPDVHELVGAAGVRVLDYHCRERASGHPTSASYAAFTLVAVREGAFCYGDHGYTRLLEPGSLVLGCPGDHYTSSHDYGCGDRCTVFEYAPATWERLRDDLGHRALPRATVFAQAPRLEALLPAAGAGELGLEEAAYRLAAAVLGTLDGAIDEVPPSLRRADRDRAHEAAGLIEAGYPGGLSLEALAGAVGMSPYHFLRLFRRELGLTPHQYLIRTRLRRALALLRSTDRSVTEIALAVGFGDLSNFVRTFRRQVGTTPEAYRQSA